MWQNCQLESLIKMVLSEGLVLKLCYLSGLIKTRYVYIYGLICFTWELLYSVPGQSQSSALVSWCLVFPSTALWGIYQRSPFLLFSTAFSYCTSFWIISLTQHSCLLIPSFNSVYFSAQSWRLTSNLWYSWPSLSSIRDYRHIPLYPAILRIFTVFLTLSFG